jgi:hypothetical protein
MTVSVWRRRRSYRWRWGGRVVRCRIGRRGYRWGRARLGRSLTNGRPLPLNELVLLRELLQAVEKAFNQGILKGEVSLYR